MRISFVVKFFFLDKKFCSDSDDKELIVYKVFKCVLYPQLAEWIETLSSVIKILITVLNLESMEAASWHRGLLTILILILFIYIWTLF